MARLMQNYSALKCFNNITLTNDSYIISLKGVQMQVLLFTLCGVFRSSIGIIPRYEPWKSLILRYFSIYACIIFIVLLFIAATNIKSAGNSYDACTLDIRILRSSKGWRSTSNTGLENSGSSSRNSTP